MDPLNPEAVAQLSARAKKQIRERMRVLRTAVPGAARATRSARICERLLELPAFVGARSVGLFWPMEERAEVDVRALDQAAREGGKAVFYPYMDRVGDVFRTGFRSVSHPEELAPRGAGFAEPRPEAPTAMRGDIDLIVVPALAVSAAGHRIGYGRGYYDVTLPDFCPPAVSVAVAFSFQLLLELPHTENDVRCEFVVTDERTLDARSG